MLLSLSATFCKDDIEAEVSGTYDTSKSEMISFDFGVITDLETFDVLDENSSRVNTWFDKYVDDIDQALMDSVNQSAETEYYDHGDWKYEEGRHA